MKKKSEVIISEDYLEELRLSNLIVKEQPSKNLKLWESKILFYLSTVSDLTQNYLSPDTPKKLQQFKTTVTKSRNILQDFILSPSFQSALFSVSERVQRGSTNGWALLLTFGWEMYKDKQLMEETKGKKRVKMVSNPLAKKAWIISELKQMESKEFRRHFGLELVRTASDRAAGRIVVPESVTDALDLQSESEKAGFFKRVCDSFWKVLVKIWDKMSTVKIHTVNTSNNKRKFYDADGKLVSYPAMATFNIQKAFPMKKIMLAAILASGSIGALAGASASKDGDKAKGGLLGALTGGGAGATGILTMMMMMNNSSTENFMKQKMMGEYGDAQAQMDMGDMGRRRSRLSPSKPNLAGRDLLVMDQEDFLSHLKESNVYVDLEGKDTEEAQRIEMLKSYLVSEGKSAEVYAAMKKKSPKEKLFFLELAFKKHVKEKQKDSSEENQDPDGLSTVRGPNGEFLTNQQAQDKAKQDKLIKELSQGITNTDRSMGKEDKDKDRDIIGLSLDLGSMGNFDMKYDDMTFYISYQVTLAIGVNS